MIVKKCPVCGNEPTALCYTSYRPLYGYVHCSIHGGYSKDWHEAKIKWNEKVEKHESKKEDE
jgi:hypothetical protein